MKAVQVKLVLLGEFFLFFHRVDESLLRSMRLDQSLFLLDQSFSPIRPLLFARRLLLLHSRMLLTQLFSLLMLPTNPTTTLATHCFAVPHIHVLLPVASLPAGLNNWPVNLHPVLWPHIYLLRRGGCGEIVACASICPERLQREHLADHWRCLPYAKYVRLNTTYVRWSMACRDQGEQESVLTPQRMQA